MLLICPTCKTEIEQTSLGVCVANCPACGISLGELGDATVLESPGSASHDLSASTHDAIAANTQEFNIVSAAPPERVGRYEIRKPLGQGSFGTVYLAFDAELHRLVAVKVPRLSRSFTDAESEVYLSEARMLARLDHPRIVPVHDVGRTNDGVCFIVSKYIEGSNLSEMISEGADLGLFVRIIVMVADALEYMHQQGLIHRDIKPANVLLDTAKNAFVADFGLAMEEEIALRGKAALAGTPAYMSPEQLRGEGHRVDGRTDIYSLGVVLYVVLTGERPFKASKLAGIVREVLSVDPPDPCELRPSVPVELQRICKRAMSRRAVDRYQSAGEMADDLRFWLKTAVDDNSVAETRAGRPVSVTPSRTNIRSGTWAETQREQFQNSDEAAVKPKGLKSFGAEDADFFLQLLPGSTDRDGLPDSVRFWKSRVEEMKANSTFTIGLIYGPSGCGKSSLVKAGLIPRLRDHVRVIYFEATPEDTEARLMRGLAETAKKLDPQLDMTQALSHIRRSADLLPPGQKILIIIDQFEQWLHAHRVSENTDLVTALRQADGERVQVIVMVRDDFWRMATRFMHDLEVPLVEGGNSAMVDLFSKRHARKVLALFGRALGCLPQHAAETSAYQELFLNRAVDGLSVDGSIISVRLSLFAEMFRNKDWSPEALARVGGTEGIGVTFLEEQFGDSAPERHLAHSEEVRAVLNALLPDPGAETDIKGEARSYDELLAASRCSRKEPFDELLGILDTELRLITPTESGEHTAGSPQPATQYFQLTHDYLVPALRTWLTQKQRETMRGRAELRLTERAASWNSKPESRQLPAAWEWISISVLTRHRDWTAPQQQMMKAANRFHAFRWTLASVLMLAAVLIGLQIRHTVNVNSNKRDAEALVARLIDAEPSQVPVIVKDLEGYRAWADPRLRDLLTAEDSDEKTKIHASLALLPVDEAQVEPLTAEMLNGTLQTLERFPVIRDSLQVSRKQIEPELWNVLQADDQSGTRRFRAGMALATYAPTSDHWTAADASLLAEQLVASSPEYQRELREFLRPIAPTLLDPIEVIFRDPLRGESERIASASALAEYAAGDPERLSELVAVADQKQYEIILSALSADPGNQSRALQALTAIIGQKPLAELPPAERLALGRRRAGAAVTMLRWGEHAAVLPAFRIDDDPESLTQTIHRLKSRGVRPIDVLNCLSVASTETERFALLLALGEFTVNDLPPAQRDETITRVEDWYANDPSSGIHGAAGWLLRTWGQNDAVARVDKHPVPYDRSGHRQWFVEEVAGQFLTWIVFTPGDAMIGSRTEEPGRKNDETQHLVHFTRPYAVCQSEVTVAMWKRFQQETNRTDGLFEEHSSSPDVPVCGPTWYTSILFCRWLSEVSGRAEAEQCYVAADKVPEDQRIQLDDGSTFPRSWPFQPERTGFRLLTEAEWERACRAGTQTAFYFGNDEKLLDHYAWWNGNSGRRSHLAGTARPNLRGLYDMHGNIFEWCHDWYGEFTDAPDPRGPADGNDRIVRGGGWFNSATISRCSARHHEQPSYRVYYSGCRIARTLPPSSEN